VGAYTALIEAVDLKAGLTGVFFYNVPDHEFMHGLLLQDVSTLIERPEQVSLCIVRGDRRGGHPGLDPFRCLRVERRPDPSIAFFVEKNVVNAHLVQQVADFDIADGGPPAAGVEKDGKERTIARTTDRAGGAGRPL